MVGEGAEINISNSELSAPDKEKLPRIKEIVSRDQQAFEQWASDPSHSQRLDIPHEALRYLLIPERIFYIADDPSAVDLLVDTQNDRQVTAFVVDHLNEPVLDKESLERYWQERVKKRAPGEALDPSLIRNVNRDHALNQELVESGQLSINDFITCYINLHALADGVLKVERYDDNDLTRGVGVATSFYSRLPNTAKDMGFRFIVGDNDEGNVVFFTKKLGRSTLEQVRPKLRGIFDESGEADLKTTTIDFLDPKDKQTFLAPSPSWNSS